jgi:hypothetical protein
MLKVNVKLQRQAIFIAIFFTACRQSLVYNNFKMTVSLPACRGGRLSVFRNLNDEEKQVIEKETKQESNPVRMRYSRNSKTIGR